MIIKLGIILLIGPIIYLYLSDNIFGKKADITEENQQTISEKIVVGKTTYEGVVALFGKPKMQFSSVVDCHPEDFAEGFDYYCDASSQWEKRKNLLVVVSLKVYFSSEGVVTGFSLKDQY